MTLEERINANYEILTPTDKDILKLLLSLDPSKPVPTVKDIAKKAHVSTTSVHRAIQKVGYKAYTQFKYSLSSFNTSNKYNVNYNEYIESSIATTLRYFSAADHQKLFMAFHNSRNIYLFGTGNEQQTALQTFANHFSYYGRPPIFIHTLTDLEIYSRKMTDKDVIIICSLNGATDNYNHVITTLKMKNTFIVSITLDTSNQLSQNSNHSLYFSSDFHDSNTKLHWPSITLRVLLDSIIYHYFDFTAHQN